MNQTQLLTIAAEAAVCMLILNGLAFAISKKGLILKIFLLSSPVAAVSFGLGILVTIYGVTPLTGTLFFATSLLAGGGFMWALKRWLIDPINTVTTAGSEVAKGNLNQKIATTGRDEVAEMAKSVQEMIGFLQEAAQIANGIAHGTLEMDITPRSERDTLGLALQQMVKNLRCLIGHQANSTLNLDRTVAQLLTTSNETGKSVQQVSDTTAEVAADVENLVNLIQNTTEQVGQLNQAIDNLAGGAQEQNRGIQQVMEAVSHISAAIEQVRQNAQAGAAVSADNAAIAEQGAGRVEQATQAMQAIKNTVTDTGSKVEQMASHSAQIGAIVDTIEDIAAQTNLLALNAAIEAARAGEQGRGFAVVADEVRRLAERTSQATQEIGQIIGAVQRGTQEAVRAMQVSLEQVETGASLAAKAGEALQLITQTAKQVNTHVGKINSETEIVRAAEEQLAGAVSNVSAIIEEYSAITEEMAAASATINQDIEAVADVSRRNSRAAANANQISNETTLKLRLLTNVAQGMGQISQQLALFTDRDTLQRRRELEDQLLHKGEKIAVDTARAVGQLFETAIEQGIFTPEEVFDHNYRPIPGTDPQKYHTAYDAFTDERLLPLQDALLADDDVVFVVAVDVNGYLPTHNSCFSQPLTGDYQTDLTGNRTKRIFDDPVGLAAARNTNPVFTQIYWRDTGETMWDVSAPIRVFGKHWGGLRVGLSMAGVANQTINSVQSFNIAGLNGTLPPAIAPGNQNGKGQKLLPTVGQAAKLTAP
ncbi:MAG: HAMP domain-containing protein [Chloroflexi bacterium]|nr:MAG: HAMP domain-containing protein [Chloroflexota bacterium]